ncbi:MAG: hypothetical protein Q9202_000430 [Teloschistes flavicans]
MGLSRLGHEEHSGPANRDAHRGLGYYLRHLGVNRKDNTEKSKSSSQDDSTSAAALLKRQREQEAHDADGRRRNKKFSDYCESHHIDPDKISDDEGME